MSPSLLEPFLDNSLLIEHGKVSTIARVHLHRSVKSHVLAGSVVRLKVAFTSEFCDPIGSLSDHVTLTAVFIKAPKDLTTILSMIKAGLCAAATKVDSKEMNPLHLTVKFPVDIGVYQLFLFSNQNPSNFDELNPDGKLIILPLLTESFNVISTDQMALKPDVSPSLSCYRLFDGIIVEEEYGKTLGSHIYDSSITILRYLARLRTLDEAIDFGKSDGDSGKRGVVLELGSGCGLVSIWLSKQNFVRRVIASDMDCQLTLLQRNIAFNSAQETCSAQSLNWSFVSRKQIENSQLLRSIGAAASSAKVPRRITGITDDLLILSDHGSSQSTASASSIPERHCKLLNMSNEEHLDMIIAGDVLYSKSLAEDFFSVVLALAVPDVTVILVAQKLRNINPEDSFDVRSVPGLRCEIVMEEAAVIIWRIFVTSSV